MGGRERRREGRVETEGREERKETEGGKEGRKKGRKETKEDEGRKELKGTHLWEPRDSRLIPLLTLPPGCAPPSPSTQISCLWPVGNLDVVPLASLS
ncbi:hypothetical protein L345_10079, partial [Ophiophagus hannah]